MPIDVYQRVSFILGKILFYGLIFILVLPLFSLRTPVLGFLLNQEILFQIIVEILFLVWLFHYLLICADKKPLINADASQHKSAGISINPRLRSPIFLSAAVFLLTLGISAAFAYNSQRAFFSTWDRFSGFWLLFHLFVFFVILITFINEKRDWLLLLAVSVGASAIASLYAISQILGLVKVPPEILSQRAFSTFGNPAFFATYLLFNIFLVLYLGVTRINADKKLIDADIYVYPAIAIIDIAALILTGTRGALLGLYVGLLLIAAVLTFFSKRRISTYIYRIATVSLIVLLLAPLLIFVLAKTFPGNFYLARLSNPFYIFEQGLKNRLIVWNVAWQAIKARPLLGWGMDNFLYGFDKYFNPRILENIRSQESWFDRAHNVFLDYLASGGIVGFLGFAIFVAGIVVASLRFLKQNPSGAVFLGLIFAYLIQGIFLFDVFQTYLMLFLVAGFLNNMQRDRPSIHVDMQSKNNRISTIYQRISIAFLLIIVIPAITFSLWSYNLKPALAMGRTWKLAALAKPDRETYARMYERVFSIKNPYTPDLWLELARREIPISNLRLVLDRFDEINNDFQLDSRYFYQVGRLGNILKSAGGPVSDAEIESNFKKALELSPRRVDIYYELAEFERLRGNSAAMLDYLNQALAWDDKIPQTHFNLAVAYSGLGKNAAAFQEAEKALDLGYASWKAKYNETVFLIDLYLKTGNHGARLVEFYQAAIYLNPNDPQLYGSLAVLLKELGRFDEAAAYAQKVTEIDPLKKGEVEEFLRSIGR